MQANTRKKHLMLLGPYGVGKSSVAEHLTKLRHWNCYELDDIGGRILKDHPRYLDLRPQSIEKRLTSEWDEPKLFIIQTLVNKISSSDNFSVLSFGFYHSVIIDQVILSEVKNLLAPYNIVLLLISDDADESLKWLLERVRQHDLKGSDLTDEKINEVNKVFLSTPSSFYLADFVVYTKGKTEEEVAKEVLNQFQK